MEHLWRWIEEYKLDDQIVDISIAGGYEGIIEWLMEEGFDHAEACRIHEYYSEHGHLQQAN